MRKGKSILVAQFLNQSKDWSGDAAIWEVSSDTCVKRPEHGQTIA